MTKTDLRACLPVKVAALFLTILLSAGCALSALGVYFCWESGFYEREGMTFVDSDAFRALAYSLMDSALDCYLYGVDPATQEGLSDGVGFTIARESDPETILYATALPQSPIWTESQPLSVSLSVEGVNMGQFLVESRETLLVTLSFDHVPTDGDFPAAERLFDLFYPLRYLLCGAIPLSLLLVLVLLTFLCCAAGHVRGREGITLNWQDRIPLDLYLAMDLGFVMLCLLLADAGGYWFSLVMAAISAVVGAVLALALLMTLATRLKAGRWWRNTLIFRAGRALFRLLRRAGHGLGKLTELLPCTWRTTLWVAGVLFLQFFLALLGLSDGAWLIPLVFLDLALLNAAVLYAWQMKQLFRAGAALAAGDLEAKVDTRRMFPPLAAHGDHLNAIGDGMNAAVEQRMRSEHFKTELITNVSHDLKTPLTSIINYVDLLKKEEITNETARGYVEVLDRKSQRLKKLTEDLIEASKASTGALTVTPERIDFNQLLEQALGEYEDRLLALDLHPMLLLAAPPVHALADGRHLWRVIDNLLSNCCKYTMPGTRVYVEAARREGLAVLSVKNISREPLNISADALMERFVRGDAARTTEGSGLGLSIARSLTEIQGGTFAVSIDGDLFKATVTFPEAP